MRRGVVTGASSDATRSLFSSFVTVALVAVSAASFLVSGTTLATFTNDSEGRGAAKAGTVDVVVNDDIDDRATFTFSGPACTNLAHGESCTAPVTIRNAGTLNATYNVRVIDSTNDCFTSVLSSEAALESGTRAPGDSIGGTLVTTLDNDMARCQGTTNNAVVVVTARQARTPHPK